MTADDRIAELAAKLKARGLHELAVEVAFTHRVELDDVLAHDQRTQAVVYVRHLLWYLIAARYRLSSPELGRLFGWSDGHVAEALRKMKARLEAAAAPPASQVRRTTRELERRAGPAARRTAGG